MKLIETPHAAFKHYSLIALGAIGTLQGTWLALPESVQALIPHGSTVMAYATIAAAVLGAVGKFIDQSPKVDQ